MTRTDASEPPPRIGLTTYREIAAWSVWNERADLLPASYADSIDRAGGVALLLPPSSADPSRAAEAVLGTVDGVVLTGGADVDPARYSAQRHPRTGAARPDRDSWEVCLARAAMALDLPVLAVCRGMQVLNVALGGDLEQHLPDRVGSDLHCPVEGEHGRHDVTFAASSRVAAVFGDGATVATYHHQGVDRVASGLVATGWASDGVVEAVEHAARTWVVGVQWHPEVHEGRSLFAAFIAAAARYRGAASAPAQHVPAATR
jgi:putative glutamine amidotransferase